MIKKISSLKSHITSKIRNFPSKVQVLCLLLLQGEAKLKFLYEMSSHFRGELRQMGGKKKLGFYSISTLNRYKFLLKSRQFPFEVSVPERLFQYDISTWINLRLNCSAMFELKRKKTMLDLGQERVFTLLWTEKKLKLSQNFKIWKSA